MPGVLEGLKVVAMEHMEAVPVATLWMADWGADVLKIEPLTGDMFRGLQAAHGTTTDIKRGDTEIRVTFQLINRNKKSMAINMKSGEGREILYRLIEKADVFMSNYTHDSLKKLKADYATLSKINPGLIYATISGYGSVGPDKDLKGFDHAAGWARTGMQEMIGEPNSVPPRLPGGTIDRGVAAPHALAGVLAALYYKQRTGKGQEIEVSLFQSGVWAIALPLQTALVGNPIIKDERTKTINPLYTVYRTKDDRWFQMSMIQPDPYWHGFCRALGKPELESDSRFSTMKLREEHCEELIRIVDDVMATKTMAEWDPVFRENDLIYARVQNSTEVINDPQALANDFFVDLPHHQGPFKTVATPVKFRQNPAEVAAAAPELGQHTELTLLELGYTWEDIARLKEIGAIL
jgi:crotonobetainyl-CoA:carnitine CoA-transferase CaiB-like acyl-CoA transferase